MSNTVKAWGVSKAGGLDALQEFDIPKPKTERPRDLLVKVHAVALNPADYKNRDNYNGAIPAPRILGWDAAGVVEAVGPEASFFKVGDEVYFSGDITRQGSFSQYAVVDERIVGRKPKSLSWEQAAAEPLTVLTAWEGLVEGMEIPVVETAPATPKSILVIAGAGGVGTSVIQIAKKLLKMNVIATATRPETIKLCKDLGADHTISHREPLKPQLDAIGLTSGVDYIYNCWTASEHWSQTSDIIKPGGKVCLVATEDELPMKGLQFKRVAVVWAMMFTRIIYNWEPELQNAILNRNSELIDSGVFYPRMTEKFAWNELPAVMKKVEEGRAIGKISVTVPQ